MNALPENQIEMIYSFVQFLSSQQTKEMPGGEKPLDDISVNYIVIICSSSNKLIIIVTTSLALSSKWSDRAKEVVISALFLTVQARFWLITLTHIKIVIAAKIKNAAKMTDGFQNSK